MRSEARIYTSRSDDRDWTSLPIGPQWAYDVLLSQADLEHHGVIALRQPRWAAQASDVTVQQLDSYLAVLAERRYIVIDERYGEVLVRSLLRVDKIFRQPNVLRSAADRLGQVKSPAIREALHAELLRIADQADLSEACALIVKEMLEATAEGAVSWTARRTRLEAKAPGNPAARPSGPGSANPPASGSPDPSRKGSPNPPGNAASGPSGKTAAYGADKPTGTASTIPSAQATPASTVDPPAPPSGDPSANPRQKGSGKGSGDPSGKPSAKRQPQAPAAAPPGVEAEGDMPRSDYRQILAAWLHSTGDRAPSADLAAAVEHVLAEALSAGEPSERVADVVRRWQQEDGTDPVRLSTMFSKASGALAASVTGTVADGTEAARPKPLGGWQLADLETATVAITNPWLETLAAQPTAEALEDIEYHVSKALIDGHRPELIAATLAAWHAAASTDTGQLTDLIETATEGDAPPQTSSATGVPQPVSAEDWLSTAKSQP